jgi:hypothetical protein
MTDGGSATSETITVLLDAQDRALTKSFRWLGDKLVKGTYPNASEFKAVEVAVNSIASLAEALDAIVSDGHAAVIRGEPSRYYPRNGSPVFVCCARK